MIPEDIRKDFGIGKNSTLVLIERKKELLIKKEDDVLGKIEEAEEDGHWKSISREAFKRAWSEEDDVWDKIYNEGNK